MAKLYQSWKDYPMEQWRWPNFSPQEMACRGTGRLMVEPRAMDMLQALRDMLDRPIIVNSAYRSPEHNKAVGGAKNSMHMQGIAFDAKMDNHNPAHYIECARKVGFKGIGTYPHQNFVHVDARPNFAQWGKPFPKRAVTPQYAPEEPRPSKNPIKHSEVTGTSLGFLTLLAQASDGVKRAIGNVTETLGVSPEVALLVIGGVSLIWIFRKHIREIAKL